MYCAGREVINGRRVVFEARTWQWTTKLPGRRYSEYVSTDSVLLFVCFFWWRLRCYCNLIKFQRTSLIAHCWRILVTGSDCRHWQETSPSLWRYEMSALILMPVCMLSWKQTVVFDVYSRCWCENLSVIAGNSVGKHSIVEQVIMSFMYGLERSSIFLAGSWFEVTDYWSLLQRAAGIFAVDLVSTLTVINTEQGILEACD